MIQKIRTHLDSVGESYFQHQFFAFRYGFNCLQAALMAFVHGICPAFFETAASDKVKKLAGLSRANHDH